MKLEPCLFPRQEMSKVLRDTTAKAPPKMKRKVCSGHLRFSARALFVWLTIFDYLTSFVESFTEAEEDLC